MSETSLKFDSENHGNVTVDFDPLAHFDFLKNRFCSPPLTIEITVEGEGDFARVALNTIDAPPIGTYLSETGDLYP
jgi:hypothetical protein